MNGAMSGEEIVGIIAISGGVLIAFIFVAMRAAVKMHRIKETESSRREIAAYIAEGSMSPEDGERLLDAGTGKNKS